MAISRSQLAKELEPGLMPCSGLNTLVMRMSIQKFLKKNLLTVRLKKK